MLVDELKKASGNVRFNRYADAGHGCWTEAYSDPTLYAGPLERKR